MTTQNRQEALDEANSDFWSELCGTHLARSVGVEDASPESLARFDRAYFDLYPYLGRYLPWHAGERLLEIGLGYGTVGKFLAERGLDYHGLDISPGPVAMIVHRLAALGLADASSRVTQGSALAVPFPDESFDVVVTIGCLHHTGDIARAVEELHRVLRPGGDAMVMLYNRHSYHRLVMLPAMILRRRLLRDRRERSEFVRASYDANTEGSAAPATEFTSAADVWRMFAAFSEVHVRRENFLDVVVTVPGRTFVFPRRVLLNNVARVAGTDLYITARK